MLNIDTFFWYFDLRYGAIIIAVFYFVGELSSILGLVLFYINSDKEALTNFSKTPLKVENNPCIIILPVLCCIGGIVITFLMVYGSMKNKHKFIVPFLIINSISIVFGFLISWAYIVFTFVKEGTIGILWLIGLNGLIGLSTYFWIVIYYRLEEIILENELFEQIGSKTANQKEPEQNFHSWAIKTKSTRININTDGPNNNLLDSAQSSEKTIDRPPIQPPDHSVV